MIRLSSSVCVGVKCLLLLCSVLLGYTVCSGAIGLLIWWMLLCCLLAVVIINSCFF